MAATNALTYRYKDPSGRVELELDDSGKLVIVERQGAWRCRRSVMFCELDPAFRLIEFLVPGYLASLGAGLLILLIFKITLFLTVILLGEKLFGGAGAALLGGGGLIYQVITKTTWCFMVKRAFRFASVQGDVDIPFHSDDRQEAEAFAADLARRAAGAFAYPLHFSPEEIALQLEDALEAGASTPDEAAELRRYFCLSNHKERNPIGFHYGS